MNLELKLIPINLEGKEDECLQTTSLRRRCFGDDQEDIEICYSVKCRSPFAKYKLIIVIDGFENEAFIQATFCSKSNNVTIVNKTHQNKIMFDGFVDNTDEGATIPFKIGPLYSTNKNIMDYMVTDIVKKIEEKQTILKVFINEAHTFNKWNKFKGLFFNQFFNEHQLIDNVEKFCKEGINCVTRDINYTTRNINVTKWVPALNYVTGKKIINIMFIFKFY
jgi:hypothetical protein